MGVQTVKDAGTMEQSQIGTKVRQRTHQGLRGHLQPGKKGPEVCFLLPRPFLTLVSVEQPLLVVAAPVGAEARPARLR